MNELEQAIQRIDQVADAIGLPELAREAEIPYTTAADWKARGWRPKSIVTFEKLVAAADKHAIAVNVSAAPKAA